MVKKKKEAGNIDMRQKTAYFALPDVLETTRVKLVKELQFRNIKNLCVSNNMAPMYSEQKLTALQWET